MRQIDQAAAVMRQVGAAAGRTYQYLMTVVQADSGSIVISQEQIGAAVNRDPRRVRDHLAELEEGGYIRREECNCPKTGWRTADRIIVVGLKVADVTAARAKAAARLSGRLLKRMKKKAAKLIADTDFSPTGHKCPDKSNVKEIYSSDGANLTEFQKIMAEYHNLKGGEFIAKFGLKWYAHCSEHG